MAETIENPVINTPFEAPSRHFVFSDEGITSTIAQVRRALGSGVRVATARCYSSSVIGTSASFSSFGP
jgi:type III restriction enzyme